MGQSGAIVWASRTETNMSTMTPQDLADLAMLRKAAEIVQKDCDDPAIGAQTPEAREAARLRLAKAKQACSEFLDRFPGGTAWPPHS